MIHEFFPNCKPLPHKKTTPAKGRGKNVYLRPAPPPRDLPPPPEREREPPKLLRELPKPERELPKLLRELPKLLRELPKLLRGRDEKPPGRGFV